MFTEHSRHIHPPTYRTPRSLLFVSVNFLLWFFSGGEPCHHHEKNAAQLAPVVRVDTAGLHGHREEGG